MAEGAADMAGEISKSISNVMENENQGGNESVSFSGQSYVNPVEDPYNKAISYLERHNILQLFQHLTSDVIFHRPNDPLEYLIQEVQQIKQQRESGQGLTKQ